MSDVLLKTHLALLWKLGAAVAWANLGHPLEPEYVHVSGAWLALLLSRWLPPYSLCRTCINQVSSVPRFHICCVLNSICSPASSQQTETTTASWWGMSTATVTASVFSCAVLSGRSVVCAFLSSRPRYPRRYGWLHMNLSDHLKSCCVHHAIDNSSSSATKIVHLAEVTTSPRTCEDDSLHVYLD